MANKSSKPQRKRDGRDRHNVRYVLVWNTVGMIVAFVIVYFLFFR
jgi:hypothetical protein